jgi:ribonuclease BN (tRNA processing enzyme)
MLAPVFQSCKKGEGDPFFSIYSRKARLCNEWKVSKYTETYEIKDTTITTEITDKQKKITVEARFIDTTIYRYYLLIGDLNYKFEKNGTYERYEAFTDDTTKVNNVTVQTGLWYFTGGGKGSATKEKELLALQMTQYTFNPMSPTTYTITYSGDNKLELFHIYSLKKNEIVLKINRSETTNITDFYKLTAEMTLVPR